MLVTNCFSTQTSYENQTKKAINNRFIQQAMTAFFKERLGLPDREQRRRRQDHGAGAHQQALARERREARRASRPTCSRKPTWPTACRSSSTAAPRTSRREVYIVEGDSAAGAIRTSRDAEFQGVMPIRGKILNCLKEDYPRIFKSEIITDLMRVLGCGVEVRTATSRTWCTSTWTT